MKGIMMKLLYDLFSLDNPQAAKFMATSVVLMVAALVTVGLVALANRHKKD
jgi:hypothetical protein